MEHNHEIFYDKIDFVIDSSTKAINSIFNNISLAHKDHNSTIFVFQMPRYIGHHDILLCNKVMIHYTNTDVLTKESFPDNFPVIDMHIDPNDEEKVLFSWRVSINATSHIGSLKFSIEFSCVDEEDVIQWSWNTFEHIGISVKNSLHNSNQVPQIYIDVLEQWKNSGQLKDGYTPVKGVDYFDGKDGKDGKDAEFPTVTEDDNGKMFGVVNGQWGVVNAPSGGASSWNDLEDKPFYDETVVYYEYVDGYTPIESVEVGDGQYLYKVSNTPLTKEELIGAELMFVDTYGDSTEIIEEVDESIPNSISNMDGTIISLSADTTGDGVTLTTGLWVYYSESSYLSKVYKDSVKKLDAKFLPEGIGEGASSWNDLKDKPFEDNTVVYYERRDGYEPLDTFADNGGVLYKVSDVPLSADELCDTVVDFYMNYEDVTLTITTVDIYDTGAFCAVCDGMVLSVFEANDAIPLGRGLWLVGEGADYVSKIYKESIKKLDSKLVESNIVTVYVDNTKIYHDVDREQVVTRGELVRIITGGNILLIHNTDEKLLVPVSYELYSDVWATIEAMSDGAVTTFHTAEYEDK